MSTTPIAIAAETARLEAFAKQRPPRASAMSAALVFAWRGMLKVKHIPEQLIHVLMIPVMFSVMFTYLFGGAMAGSTGAYLEYLLPGTLVMSVMLLTVDTGVGLNTDITRGVFDRYRSLPIWRPAPLVGALVGDTARYLLASSVVVGLGLMMGYRPDGGVTGVLAAVLLVLVFAFSLSWIWLALGLVLRTPGSVTTVGFLILFPLTFASNVYVDPETTPSWLHAFIDVNPVSHLVTATRGLTSGAASANDIAVVLAIAAAQLIVFAPLVVSLYGRKQ